MRSAVELPQKYLFRKCGYESGGIAVGVGVFISNKTQAVRLPKAVALPKTVKQVDIVALGRSRLIAPAGEAWDSWFEGGRRFQ